jgi:hypothetical protein
MRYREDRHESTFDGGIDLVDRRCPRALEPHDLGHVVHEPHPVVNSRIEGEHNAEPRNTTQFREAGRSIWPVVNGKYGHHGVERSAREGQGLGRGANGWSSRRRALREHDA